MAGSHYSLEEAVDNRVRSARKMNITQCAWKALPCLLDKRLQGTGFQPESICCIMSGHFVPVINRFASIALQAKPHHFPKGC